MDPLKASIEDTGILRKFETGATRDTEQDKLDYHGFLSPIVLERFAQYMHKHRKLPDGSFRSSSNWQKGIPIEIYAKSLIRHTIQLWKCHMGFATHDEKGQSVDIADALCAIMFNAMGMLFEILKKKQ